VQSEAASDAVFEESDPLQALKATSHNDAAIKAMDFMRSQSCKE
jgi:hypothetical protein